MIICKIMDFRGEMCSPNDGNYSGTNVFARSFVPYVGQSRCTACVYLEEEKTEALLGGRWGRQEYTYGDVVEGTNMPDERDLETTKKS